MCLYPKIIRNKKYQSNTKNGGIIPPVYDTRVLHVPIKCGKCIECAKQKAREWQVRLLEDIKQNKNGKFITLTFSDESIAKLVTQIKNKEAKGYDLDNEIATKAIELFRERWRKKFGKSIRHWLITELGHNGTENIHMHGILWTNESFQTIRQIWQYGFIWPRPEQEKTNFVGAITINYIIKYVHKQDEKHPSYQSITLTSPGIGSNYTKSYDYITNKYKERETNETYRTNTGHKIAMPIYWRNKRYTEEERELLWLEKLNKNERWICGEKIKADDDKTFYNLLEWHRKRSKKLGYGDDKINWNREAYEMERRTINQQTRIKNGTNTNKRMEIKNPTHTTRTREKTHEE